VDIQRGWGWKKRFFQCDHADVRGNSCEADAWFDVEVVYTGAVPDRAFSGDPPDRHSTFAG